MRLHWLFMIIVLVAAGSGAMLAAAPTGTANPSSASAPAAPRVKLWENTPGVVSAGRDTDGDPIEPTMDIYLLAKGRESGAAVVILPGGGYTNLAVAKEGTAVAQMFLSHDVAAFVVRYRHASRYHYPIPILDAQRALRMVRAKAADFRVKPDRVGILGFSAGGHLAASVATMYESGPKPEKPDAIDAVSARPDFAMLIYPVINMTDDTIVHKGSRASLTQNDKSLYPLLSPEQHVTKDTPPMFLVHGNNDKTVPVMNSVLMYEACVKAGVPAELHIFENGPHGFGLGSDDATKTWPDVAIRWMGRHRFFEK